MPNLITDRPDLLALRRASVDVRQLMYQTLICLVRGVDTGRDDPRRLAAPLDAQLFERAADSLVDSVRADAQARRDFLAVQMLVDEQQAFDLAGAQAREGGGGIAFDPRPSHLARAWLNQPVFPSEQSKGNL